MSGVNGVYEGFAFWGCEVRRRGCSISCGECEGMAGAGEYLQVSHIHNMSFI